MDGDPFGLLGTVLDGKFLVDSLVGEGELSVIFKGYHLAANAPVAIKCLHLPDTLDPALTRPVVEAFEDAGRLQDLLGRGNPHVAQTIASGRTTAPRTGTTVPYRVREWFEGESLGAELARRKRQGDKPPTAEEAFALLAPAIEGIAHAHEKGVAHLSLGPGNLFLARGEGTCSLKVLDFGTARSNLPADSRPTLDSEVTRGLHLLSPAYAAPEQLDKVVGAPGPWTDVYALALIMMDVLAGGSDVEGRDTPALVQRALDKQTRPTPQTRGLKLPRALDLALTQAVARSPEARQKDARIFLNDLRASLSQRAPNPAPAPAPAKALPPRAASARVAPAMATKLGQPQAPEPRANGGWIIERAPAVLAAVPPPAVPSPAAPAPRQETPALEPVAVPRAAPAVAPAPAALVVASPPSAAAAVPPVAPVAAPLPPPPVAVAPPPSPPPAVAALPPTSPLAELSMPLATAVSRPVPAPVLEAPSIPRLAPPPSFAPALADLDPAAIEREESVAPRRLPSRPVWIGVAGVAACAAIAAVIFALPRARRPIQQTVTAMPAPNAPRFVPSASAPPAAPAAPPPAVGALEPGSPAPHAGGAAMAFVARPAKPPGRTDPSVPRFSRAAANRAINSEIPQVGRCRRGRLWGSGYATIAFANDGSVDRVLVDPPFSMTVTGKCVADALGEAHMGSFSGRMGYYRFRFFIDPR